MLWQVIRPITHRICVRIIATRQLLKIKWIGIVNMGIFICFENTAILNRRHPPKWPPLRPFVIWLNFTSKGKSVFMVKSFLLWYRFRKKHALYPVQCAIGNGILSMISELNVPIIMMWKFTQNHFVEICVNTHKNSFSSFSNSTVYKSFLNLILPFTQLTKYLFLASNCTKRSKRHVFNTMTS